ncbi:hypothetical protein [Pseudoflavonifractor phocaeensis]|uniref:hypothetical protein n=1 Tax=Pseudoflavonifractor phocaeensis TaxID=1870988 RepID=UPI001FAED437|nr:hypothetical protein [Pseudoflavonifractor phocaeensis]
MDRLLLMRGTEALGAVRVFAVFVAVFMASLAFPDYAAALAASGIVPFIAILAQGGTSVPHIVIPPYEGAALLAVYGMFIQTACAQFLTIKSCTFFQGPFLAANVTNEGTGLHIMRSFSDNRPFQ